MIFVEPGADDTAAARMINNEFDVGPAMQPGVFEAAQRPEPEHRQLEHVRVPSWGAPDACVYTLGLNTRWGPMADVHVRRAIEHAINRQQLVDLAYEGATVPLVVPFSTYGGLAAYQTQMHEHHRPVQARQSGPEPWWPAKCSRPATPRTPAGSGPRTARG